MTTFVFYDMWLIHSSNCCFSFYRYLYCDEISLEADTVLPTLYAAKKYIMPHLAKACVEYLETNLDASNAWLLLHHSRLFEESELMKRCLDVIDTQANEALQADSFTSIDYQTLELILGRDNLCADETVVFTVAVRWAEAECTRQGRDISPQQCREVLGDALYLIRFPVMTPSDFADGACQSGLLNKQEMIDILLYFAAKENKPKLRFSTIFRMPRTPHCCLRYQEIVQYEYWLNPNGMESIQFSVDKPISVAGFGLYGSCTASSGYPIDITLTHNGVALRQKHHNICCDGSSKTVHVLFDNPVRIEPNTYYRVSLVVKNPMHCHYGRAGMPRLTCGDFNFTFMEYSDIKNWTSVAKGQIPEILFYHWPDTNYNWSYWVFQADIRLSAGLVLFSKS